MMDSKKLCPNCRTGLLSLQLDRGEPMCPYILMHSGGNCPYFVSAEQQDIHKKETRCEAKNKKLFKWFLGK